MAGAPRFAMVAGEASGDLLASLVLDGMRARWPELQAVGIGGPQMARRGFQAWWPHDKLAVRGYVEVLRHYLEIVGIRRQLRDRLLSDKPDLFIGVDAPDFNLDLEGALRASGVRTVHFICPSIWAWRADRVAKIRASADHVLCIFPFEPALLAEHGIPATYVGHPLANVIPLDPDREAARRLLGLPASDTVVAVLPGSRSSEIDYLARPFFDTVAAIEAVRPGLHFVVPAVPSLQERIVQAARAAGVAHRVQVVAGQSHAVLAACDVALVASGTATLETALFKRPMVIAYRMNGLSWQIMRRKKLQPWVGLPNILCNDFVVPELLQQDATPEAMRDALLGWLDAPDRVRELQARFGQMHNELARDTARLATDAIQKVLQA